MENALDMLSVSLHFHFHYYHLRKPLDPKNHGTSEWESNEILIPTRKGKVKKKKTVQTVDSDNLYRGKIFIYRLDTWSL